MKYLVLGNGYLGNRFAEYFNCTLEASRINSTQDALKLIEIYNPEVIINCIGKTGKPNVDWCEDNKESTFDGNVSTPSQIALACEMKGVKMVHIGSGCIFEGDNNGQGFSEEDKPNFRGSFYSRTKIMSEKLLEEFDVLQLRIRMPLDSRPGGRNLLNKIKNYKTILSTPNSITIIDDLLRVTKELLEKDATGIYNVVNPGEMTNDHLLNLYSQISGNELSFSIVSADQFEGMTKARRSNCILSTNKLTNSGIQISPINDAVKSCLQKYWENEQ